MGEVERLPEWVGDWRVARWIGGGITADDVRHRLPYWTVRQAQVMISAEQQVQATAQKRQAEQQNGGAL